jgi:hypothetical protein
LIFPKPLDSDEKWRGVRDLNSFKEDGLPADKTYVPITSVGYSRDSSLVAIGYRDAVLQSFPASILDGDVTCATTA